MLHDGHWGVARMKQIARRYCWFLNIDKQIEQLAKSCQTCQVASSDPKKNFSSWPVAEKPWERIHIDFAGPFVNKMWLICVDSFSKYPYTVEMPNITSTTTILALQKIFSLEGLPETIISDNGPQLVSNEFEEFCKLNSITHLTTAPFHPASNGQAERFVRTFKTSFSKIMTEEKNSQLALLKFLSTYRSTPDPISQKSPAELLHGRQPRNLLSVLLPNAQHQLSEDHESQFQSNQFVFAKNFSKGAKWIEGRVIKKMGRKMFLVETEAGVCRRHQNQLRRRYLNQKIISHFRQPHNFEVTLPNQSDVLPYIDQSSSPGSHQQSTPSPKRSCLVNNQSPNGNHQNPSSSSTSDAVNHNPIVEPSTSCSIPSQRDNQSGQTSEVASPRRSERKKIPTVRFQASTGR